MSLTRKKDDFHWTADNLFSHNKTFNFAVSGRGPGKTTNILNKMMKWHKKGYMLIVLKRQIVDISDTTLDDLANAYNILQDDDNKITLSYKKGDLGRGIADIYIDGEDIPFFRLIALSNPKYRLKGMAFDRPVAWILFDEYKISGTEKYLKDEYSKFQELYSTLARFGIEKDGEIQPPKVIFLGNNYSLTDPYMANMKIPVHKIKPGQIITGENWAFEDIKINDKLKEFLLKQNPLFQFGDDAYNKYALDGISVSDQRINVVEKQPDYFKLNYVFYIDNKYLGVYYNSHDKIIGEYRYWIGIIKDYNASKRRNVICFDFNSLVDGTTLFGPTDRCRFQLLQTAFRFREIAYKSIYEGYLFEQIYDLI